MESEQGELEQRQNHKGREQEQEWRGARPERKQTAGAMDTSGKVRNSPFPSP
jgi:hypothetical protein